VAEEDAAIHGHAHAEASGKHADFLRGPENHEIAFQEKVKRLATESNCDQVKGFRGFLGFPHASPRQYAFLLVNMRSRVMLMICRSKVKLQLRR
jgi:hypothetical protein